jgi:hypothetical protein
MSNTALAAHAARRTLFGVKADAQHVCCTRGFPCASCFASR